MVLGENLSQLGNYRGQQGLANCTFLFMVISNYAKISTLFFSKSMGIPNFLKVVYFFKQVYFTQLSVVFLIEFILTLSNFVCVCVCVYTHTKDFPFVNPNGIDTC